MTVTRYTSALVLLMAGAISFAADEHAAMDKPSFTATQTEIIKATVEAINHETREVTLRGAEGNAVTFNITFDIEGQELAAEFKGTIEGDTPAASPAPGAPGTPPS